MFVVMVCLIGIVYIYMVVDSLKVKVKDMNVMFKVEINGFSGVKNVLMKEEIENVIVIIVVVDK